MKTTDRKNVCYCLVLSKLLLSTCYAIISTKSKSQQLGYVTITFKTKCIVVNIQTAQKCLAFYTNTTCSKLVPEEVMPQLKIKNLSALLTTWNFSLIIRQCSNYSQNIINSSKAQMQTREKENIKLTRVAIR